MSYYSRSSSVPTLALCHLKSIFKIVVVALFLICNFALAEAISNNAVTNMSIVGAKAPPRGNPPFYFSGTNCQVAGQIIPYAENYVGDFYLATAELKINGNVVKTFTYNPLLPNLYPVVLSATFDSTHFASGTTVIVQISGYDNLGGYYEDDYQVIAKNRIVALNQSSITQYLVPHSNAATGFLSGPTISNYDITYYDSYHWTDSDQFNYQFNSNVLVVGSHGNPVVHDTGAGDIGSYPGDTWSYVTPFTAEAAQQSNVGTGLPPYNSTSSPPIQFAYIVACNVGDSNDFIRYCWPYQQWNSQSWLVDQCFVAFNTFVLLRCYTQFGNGLCKYLKLGDCVSVARSNMPFDATISPSEFVVRDIDSGQYDRTFQVGDLSLYGDPYTRIKNVYLQSTTR